MAPRRAGADAAARKKVPTDEDDRALAGGFKQMVTHISDLPDTSATVERLAQHGIQRVILITIAALVASQFLSLIYAEHHDKSLKQALPWDVDDPSGLTELGVFNATIVINDTEYTVTQDDIVTLWAASGTAKANAPIGQVLRDGFKDQGVLYGMLAVVGLIAGLLAIAHLWKMYKRHKLLELVKESEAAKIRTNLGAYLPFRNFFIEITTWAHVINMGMALAILFYNFGYTVWLHNEEVHLYNLGWMIAASVWVLWGIEVFQVVVYITQGIAAYMGRIRAGNITHAPYNVEYVKDVTELHSAEEAAYERQKARLNPITSYRNPMYMQ
jgi:hypothetical protein